MSSLSLEDDSSPDISSNNENMLLLLFKNGILALISGSNFSLVAASSSSNIFICLGLITEERLRPYTLIILVGSRTNPSSNDSMNCFYFLNDRSLCCRFIIEISPLCPRSSSVSVEFSSITATLILCGAFSVFIVFTFVSSRY